MKPHHRLALLLTLASALFASGCAAAGSPVVAWEGEPYGMLRTDLKVILGNHEPTILSDLIPLPLAIVDLPAALVFDTALLPLAVVRRVMRG